MPSLQLNSLLSWHLTFLQQRTTGVAKACFALNASYKWCLSGTPVQNRIGEFFSLLRFLQVRPFASYFCKQCPCSQLQWTANKQGRCTECSHTYVSSSKQSIFLTLTITSGDSTISRFSTRKSSTQVSQSSRRQVYSFGNLIQILVTEGRTTEERKIGLQKLRLITDHIMLRRLKQEHTSSMELPPKR